ncbi:dienelactone hydrolase family protein [Rubellimicrobium mesophilum]|nr:dienelactone hydrolase family protein [Rubellimicrobium mesophilum]
MPSLLRAGLRGPALRLAAALLGLLLAASCGPLVQEAPEAREARLAPSWRLVQPEGPGRRPAAIVLSGCDGVHDNMAFWAEALARRGRAVLILDSHAPRGLDRDPAWRLVCAGQVLRGAERAGDVAAALDALARSPGVDASDVVLLGASHGGWTAMEFVGLAATGRTPPGLARWPEPPAAMLGRISALVLLYPYCGLLNGARAGEWRGAPPTLMILSERDRVVSAPACAERAEALGATGAEVRVEVMPGADHGFDQAEKSPLSPLPFDPARRALALEATQEFLDGLGL